MPQSNIKPWFQEDAELEQRHTRIKAIISLAKQSALVFLIKIIAKLERIQKSISQNRVRTLKPTHNQSNNEL